MSRVGEWLLPARLGPQYRRLLAASWISNLGDGILLAASPLLVASQTHDPLLVALVGLTLLYATVYMQAYTTLPLAIRDAGLSAADYGTVIAVNGVAVVLLQPFAAPWLARVDGMTVAGV